MARTEYPLAARQQAAQSLAALTQAGGPLEYLDKNTNVKVEGKGKEFLSRISATTPKDGFAFMTEIEFSGTMDGCRGQQVWLSEEWQFWSIAAPPKDIGAGGAVVHKRGDIDMPDATIPPKKRSDKHTAIMPTPASIYTFKSLRAQMTIPTDPVYADEQVLRCYDWEYEWTNMAKDGDKPAKEGKKMESAGDWGKAAGSVTITLKGEPPDKKCKV